ncbi:hypothetical protein GCM10008949_45000 [Deinococcus humi]|nr:hypothetical protein GCM10008949_45000 [Deinococcus humi]
MADVRSVCKQALLNGVDNAVSDGFADESAVGVYHDVRWLGRLSDVAFPSEKFVVVASIMPPAVVTEANANVV